MEIKDINKCPECGGELICDDNVLFLSPPVFGATCASCGNKYRSFKQIGKSKNEAGNIIWKC